jgi:polyhydroxyalkanoate synthase
MGVAADPIEFVAARRLDALACARDPEALAAHLRVVHWTLDELAMPARLFSDIAARLCRDDEFHRGTLAVARRRAAPGQIGMPILAVVNPHGRLVPPRSVLPVLKRTAGPHTIRWHAERAPGAALRHVGALVGRDAHRVLWPSVLRWASAVWQGETRRGG